LANAPFLKVEATKFTEVGYVGRDVESIIRDLADIGIKLAREQEMAKLAGQAEAAAEERILDALLPPPSSFEEESRSTTSSATREKFRHRLRAGELDEREIEIQVSASPMGVEIMAPPGMEEMTNQLQGLFQNLGQGRMKRRKLRIRDARQLLKDEEAAKRVNDEELKLRAIENVEQNGIVFLDELDKVTKRNVISCRWSRAAQCRPSTARCARTISSSSPPAHSIFPNRRI
jgi:ATP-dependent HslUV protease ATP-binding subunit HslU